MAGFQRRAADGSKDAKWEPGKQVRDLNHYVKQNIKMYLPAPEPGINADALSSVSCDGVKDASPLMSANAMLMYTQAPNSELVNRPALGYSELACNLLAFNINLEEGVRNKIYHSDPDDKTHWMTLWCSAWKAHRLEDVCSVLNNQLAVLHSDGDPKTYTHNTLPKGFLHL